MFLLVQGLEYIFVTTSEDTTYFFYFELWPGYLRDWKYLTTIQPNLDLTMNTFAWLEKNKYLSIQDFSFTNFRGSCSFDGHMFNFFV